MIFKPGSNRRWQTTQDIQWHVGRKQSGYVIEIPAGREFESSVPRWGRWILHPDDPQFLLAALVHDVMLEEGIFGPLQACAEWFDGAIAGGAPRWKAKVAYIAISVWATRSA